MYVCSWPIWFRSGFEFCHCKIRFWKVQSIFSHFVRRDTSHLSKTVSGFFGRYHNSILDNETIVLLSIFYLIKLSRERAIKYHAPFGNMVTMPPPCLAQNHAKTWTGRGRHQQKKLADSWISAHWFNATDDKKHMYSLKKHTFCPWACWSAARRTSSNKIKV